MGISGAGGVGAGMGAGGFAGAAGVGAAGASAGASAAGASNASQAAGGAAQTSGANTLQSLANAMKDFSSAEILIALMMASAAGGKDDKEGGSAAAGFLAGLAMAGGLGQNAGINLSIDASSGVQAPDAAGAGGAGLSLNVSI